MYLILYPSQRLSDHGYVDGIFEALYTTDMHLVAKMLLEDQVTVYKINSLTQIKDIQITYQEVTQETNNE